jgi:hypothetical protein
MSMRTGFHNDAFVELERFNHEERTIVNKLSSQWYVTRASNLKIGEKSEYRFCLIKPTERFKEMFNLEREIIVVFSSYSEIEPRTLDSIDKINSLFPALRLEKICCIVFSKDKNCELKINDLLKQDQESQIIIPISYSDFKDSTDKFFIENKFRKHFYNRDLFAFESPLKKDLYFFGRTDIIHKIVNRHDSNENSALFGLRKTGKTSVIFKVERTLEKKGSKSIWIDCQNTAFNKRRWNEALHYIIFLIRDKYEYEIKNYSKEIDAGMPRFKEEKRYTEKDAAIIFEEEILKLHKLFQSNSILLIFDEIERITFEVGENENWANGNDFIFFWQTLRSVFQKLNSVFSYLIVGTNSMCVERPLINGKDNPLFNSVPFNYIERFGVSETKEMVDKLANFIGLKFDETIFTKLTEDFGGHPFLIRHVCSAINSIVPQERPFTVDRIIYEKAKKDFNEKSSTYLEMMLGILTAYYPDEYLMLEYLAIGEVETFNYFASSSPEYTQHLIGYGIISKINNVYDFKIDSVKDYLSSKNKYKKINQSVEEMYRECEERRNKLEPNLRKIIRFVIKSRFGENEGKNKILQLFNSEARSKISELTLSEIMNADKNKFLTLNQLQVIIYGNWEVFQHIFKEQKGFEHRMNIVNTLGRSDTHSKTINNEQMAEFRVSMNWLENKVKEFEI